MVQYAFPHRITYYYIYTMRIYRELLERYHAEYTALKRKYNLVATIRLAVMITLAFCIYKSFSAGNTVYIISSLILLAGFIVLLNIHTKISKESRIKKSLEDINRDELDYLDGNKIPFKDGNEYMDYKHFYSFDLDIFGKNSLFHHLNRTTTFSGKEKFARLLSGLLSNEKIQANQEAIQELKDKLNHRQYINALGRISEDSKEQFENLFNWSEAKPGEISTIIRVLSYLVPALFLITLLFNIFSDRSIYAAPLLTLFIINMGLVSLQIKKIQQELIDADKIPDLLQQYGLILEQIENEAYESAWLKSLQLKLRYTSGNASTQIKKLSNILSNIEKAQNLIASLLFNGSLAYHLHLLNRLLKWKKQYAHSIKEWLDVIGEFEALSSPANFSYNNPEFVYPTLNSEYKTEFENIGHPLIRNEKRVCNDISFTEKNFIILTGSNMSGKSTFLRTLGMNMVLAGTGSPVCASKAIIHPLKVLVSMRQTDSLTDSESYFFAEVKRLRQIMDQVEFQTCFVLLDEILKGTNSDDKQTGMIEVIRKMAAKNTIGCIATHDLEVCKTTNEFQDKLINKCFEVEIINNDLFFDYKLRDGICKNKSATFLMKKMGII